MDDAIAQNTDLQQQLNEAQSELLHVEGVSEQWADIAQNREDLVDALQAERDQAQRERDEAQAQIAQLQEQLAATRPSKTVMQLNAELEAASQGSEQRRAIIADLRSQLNAKDKEIEDIQRQYRSMAENLKRERDELRQQMEAGAPGAGLDLEALAKERDRILSQTRSDKLKAVKTALDQFLSAIHERASP